MDEAGWRHVTGQREALADLLAGLRPEQWETRSLCTQWRVQDVAAHLTMTPAGLPRPGPMARALVAARGHLWDAGRDIAVAYAARGPAQIVEDLRGDASSRTKPVFVVADNILLDLLVHGQDIARPLGIDHPVPPAAAHTALDRVWAMGWPFHARRRLDGVRLHDVDSGWTGGEGPEVRGSSASLLLLATARYEAGLAGLEGPGRAELEARLSASVASDGR